MSGNFAIKGWGGDGPLMANAILNFHFDYLNPSLIWSMGVIWLPLFAIPVFVLTSNILKVVDSIFQGMLLFYGFRSRAAALDPMRSVYRSDKMKEADVLLAVKDVGWFWGVAVLLKICVTSCLGWSCVQCAWKGHCCCQPLLWIFYCLWYK